MTDRIQHIIEDIRLKTKALHHQLNEEREKNNTFQAEVQVLNERLHYQKQQEESYLAEIAALKLEMETTKSQVIEIERPQGKKDEEIDELVKEIEYCISQLKK
jgi:septal ring factor EnvC (AmiA/AmiB activator)